MTNMTNGYDVNCAACQAVVGACVACGGCFRRHCHCDPCQHGYERTQIQACLSCRPGSYYRLQVCLDCDQTYDPRTSSTHCPHDEVRD